MDKCCSHPKKVILTFVIFEFLNCCLVSSFHQLRRDSYYYNYNPHSLPHYSIPAAESAYDEEGEEEYPYRNSDPYFFEDVNDEAYENDYEDYYYVAPGSRKPTFLDRHGMPEPFGHSVGNYYEDSYPHPHPYHGGYAYEDEPGFFGGDDDDEEFFIQHDPDFLHELASPFPPPPYPPPPFGSPDPGFKTQTGFEGYLVPNSWYGLLPWGIEGVVIVIAGIIIFVIIVIAIICLIAWFAGIRKLLPTWLLTRQSAPGTMNIPEFESRAFFQQTSEFADFTIRVFSAIEKYN